MNYNLGIGQSFHLSLRYHSSLQNICDNLSKYKSLRSMKQWLWKINTGGHQKKKWGGGGIICEDFYCPSLPQKEKKLGKLEVVSVRN